VLVLDEPLNGLDPMARAESIALFEAIAKQGMHVIISSHILEEVDRISDRVVLMSSDALRCLRRDRFRRGPKGGARSSMQILVAVCSNARDLAAAAFNSITLSEAKILKMPRSMVRTTDADHFIYLLKQDCFQRFVEVDTVRPRR